jgi:hypothetical protein
MVVHFCPGYKELGLVELSIFHIPNLTLYYQLFQVYFKTCIHKHIFTFTQTCSCIHNMVYIYTNTCSHIYKHMYSYTQT